MKLTLNSIRLCAFVAGLCLSCAVTEVTMRPTPRWDSFAVTLLIGIFYAYLATRPVEP